MNYGDFVFLELGHWSVAVMIHEICKASEIKQKKILTPQAHP